MKIGLYSLIMPRLEISFLEEWVNHHFNLGVTKAFIYNNGSISIDNSEWAKGSRPLTESEFGIKWKKKPNANYNLHLTESEINSSVMKLSNHNFSVESWIYGIDHNDEYPDSQLTGYRHCVENNPDIDWWLFIDPDEFIVLKKHKSFEALISDYPPVGCFQFSQRIFEERKVGEPVREIFLWGYDAQIFKGLNKDIVEYGVHYSAPSNGNVMQVSRDTALIHHYRGAPIDKGYGPKYNVDGVIFDKTDFSMRKYL